MAKKYHRFVCREIKRSDGSSYYGEVCETYVKRANAKKKSTKNKGKK